MLSFPQKSLFFFLGALTLSGCDQTKEMFGMKREKPDEFTILSRPPLSAPPGIGLTPPLPQGVKAPGQKTEADAKRALLGDHDGGSTQAASDLETSVLEKAKTEDANPKIRAELSHSLDKESSEEAPLQDVFYWQKKEDSGKVIDPHREYEKHHHEAHPTKES